MAAGVVAAAVVEEAEVLVQVAVVDYTDTDLAGAS